MATKKARVEAQLRMEKDTLKAIVSSLTENVTILGQDYRIYFQNRSSLEKFGALTGKLCYEEFMKRREPCESCLTVKAIKTNSAQCAEMIGPDARYYEVTATPFVEANGVTKAAHLMRDITERKRAEEALLRRNTELATLNIVAQSASRSTRLSDVLQTALDSALEVTGLPAGGIWLLDEDAKELVLTVHKGVGEAFVQAAGKMPLGISITGRVAETGGMIVTTNLLEDARLDPSRKLAAESEQVQSLISVPLSSKGRILGEMNIFARCHKDFPAGDIGLLETLGDEMEVAIENAQLLEKTRELSVIDELTGLYNRRHFYEVLETEMHRTQCYGRSFSLVLLDLDGFKKYNDAFGHTNGDSVLKSLARTLRSSLRKADATFRYGGDEFTIILPVTDAHRAKKIVDRIRSKWLLAPKAEHLLLESPLGLSAGVAQFPENAETADGLVFLADTALYHSKRAGGYKTTLASALGTLETDMLDRATLDQVYALAATVEARDPFTYGHSKRVAAISAMIGKAIRLSRKELANLHAASLLHDIGKVGISDSILTKPGRLAEDEWELLRKHSAEGARIVGYVKELAPLVPIIRHHHEWYDGTGYPDGLKGEDIPFGARVISIADAYDTMTTTRNYRDIVSQEEAFEELRRCSGTQFDPELVELLCRAMNEATKHDQTD